MKVNGFGGNIYTPRPTKTSNAKSTFNNLATQAMKSDISRPQTFAETLKNAAAYSNNTIAKQHLANTQTAAKTGTAGEETSLNLSIKWEPKANPLISLEAFSAAISEREKGAMAVPMGKAELPEFMEELEKALANGESLRDVLQKQIGKHTEEDGSILYMDKDTFYIDPNTGDVKFVMPKGGCLYYTNGKSDGLEDPVWDLAYDLSQFLRHTYFKADGDNPEESAKIIADIKARQDSKDYIRFDCDIRPEEASTEEHSTRYVYSKEDNNDFAIIDKVIANIRAGQENKDYIKFDPNTKKETPSIKEQFTALENGTEL